jgi:hypothetical protein
MFLNRHLTLHVFFVNFNGNTKDLCILQRLTYIVSKAPLERSKLIFVEIEGFDSIHKILPRNKSMLLANQIK